MKTLCTVASIACLFSACGVAAAQQQQQPAQRQPSQQPIQQPSQQQQSAQQQYVPPQTLGPLNPATSPRQPEQEIIYMGHEQARLGVTLAEDGKGHVWIRSVIAGSPADRAHLRPGDQMLAMNESVIHSYADAVRFINASHPDQEVTIAFNRDGNHGGATAVLGWARGTQSNTVTVPSGSIQFQIKTPNQTYNPEYVYPNKPGEYQQPWKYGHLGTSPDTTAPAAKGSNRAEAIGGEGNGVGNGGGQPGQK
jgi:membrane-associated protease RseP (regulator of RpoE activity)